MPSHVLSPVPPLSELKELLDYNAETGVFTWRKDRGVKSKAGGIAGSILPSGYYVVSVDRRNYNGLSLAWYFLHGRWPTGGKVMPKDDDRGNAAADNLVFHETVLSDRKTAKYMRDYRQRKVSLKQRTDSPIADVQFSPQRNRWMVHLPHHPDNVFVASYTTWEAAVRGYYDRLAIIERLKELPPAYPDASWQAIRAGNTGMTLATADSFFCYDPDNGAVYLRKRLPRGPSRGGKPKPHDAVDFSEGTRVDIVTRNGRRVVRYDGRDYPVGMLAMFLRHHQWPARKSVTHKDGDPLNTKWSNLHWERDAPKGPPAADAPRPSVAGSLERLKRRYVHGQMTDSELDQKAAQFDYTRTKPDA